jgi:hypothetical protein
MRLSPRSVNGNPFPKHPLHTWSMQWNLISKRPVHKCGTLWIRFQKLPIHKREHTETGFEKLSFILGSYKGKILISEKVPIHTGVHKGNCKRIQF